MAAWIGAILIMIGISIEAALFAMVHHDKEKRRHNREQIGRYLAESRALLARSRSAGKNTPFDAEVQTWADGVAGFLETQLGPSYVQLLQHDDRSWRYASGPSASEVTPFLERANARLGDILKALS